MSAYKLAPSPRFPDLPTTLIISYRIASMYCTRAIISRGLYIFYPISKDNFFVFKEVFSENSVLMYGLYSRAASNQEQLMMARVRYNRLIEKISLVSHSDRPYTCYRLVR